MSAQTGERVESIEQFDWTRPCESRAHKQNPPPANFLVDIHGCLAKFACLDCVRFDQTEFARHGGFTCRHCGKFFATWAEAEQVMPL